MRFKSLHMKNFRGIRDLRIDFEPNMTVIVGRNGAGKTAILDALGELARVLRAQLKSKKRGFPRHQLSARDVRMGTSGFALSLDYEYGDERSGPSDGGQLQATYDVGTGTLNFERPRVLRSWSDAIEFQPRFIYYRQNRGFETQQSWWSRDADKTFDPDAVQDSSLNEDLSAIGDLEAWWDGRDADEARVVRDKDPSYRDPQLQAIRELVTRIDGFSGISFSSTASPPGLRLTKDDKEQIHVSGLSGGERSYIIRLADLARRLQVFAPDEKLEAIPAIVMIDEIELNLHPAWQSEIGPTLTGVFKACQFIVTTHSPQVISGIDSANVRVLHQEPSGPTEVAIPLNTKGRTSNYLLDGVFGASVRYPPIGRLIDAFNGAIDRKDAAAAGKTLARIETEIEGDTPTVLVLRKRLKTLRDGR